MLRLFLFWLVCLSCVLPVHAQLNLVWALRDDLNAQLPPSIKVYETNNGTLPLTAWYIKADLSDTTWTTDALLNSGQTTQAFAQESEALVAVNGGYFGGSQSFSLVTSGGQTLVSNIGALNRSGVTYYPTRGTFGMSDANTPEVAWVYTTNGTTYAYPTPNANTQNQAQPQPTPTFPTGGTAWPIVTGIGGGPVLVKNRNARITWEEEVFFGSGIGSITDVNPRTAIGYTAANELLLLVVDGRQTRSRGVSLQELAQIMIELGAVDALNLDGGGSSTLIINNTLINRPEGGTFQRSVASAFALIPKPLSPLPSNAFFFDTGDTCCYKEFGTGWIDSANAPFFGSTPSRLNAAQTVDAARAVFTFEDIPDGMYEVAAWWVPAFNRAINTPFTLYHQGADTTIRIDQSAATTLNQWNTLGTFQLTANDSLVVSDDAVGTSAIVYVNVDAVRLTPLSRLSTNESQALPENPLSVYPNPTAGHLNLSYTLRYESLIQGEVRDVVGRVVHRFSIQGLHGQQNHTLRLPDLAAGLYVIRLHTSQGIQQKPFILAR